MTLPTFPIRLEFLQMWQAAALYLILALPILWLGMRSLNGLDAARKWASIGLRLDLLMLLVLILAGARWIKVAKDLTVVAVRDVSQSIQNVKSTDPGGVGAEISRYVADQVKTKPPNDRLGTVRFDGRPWVDELPSVTPTSNAAAIHPPTDGTDIAQAIELALAVMPPDTMHRIVLFSDGNANRGDLRQAVTAAAAQHVPVDVVPLNYSIEHEIAIEKIVAPSIVRRGSPFTLDVLMQSQNSGPVRARLSLTDNGVPFVMQHTDGGTATSRDIQLTPGVNVEHLQLPEESPGAHDFRVVLEPLGPGAIDTINRNNTAESVSLVLGKPKVLYVSGPHEDAGEPLRQTLKDAGIGVEEVDPEAVPRRLTDLQQYDTVILSNVPLAYGGLDSSQASTICQYVTDMGGGLVVIGGPDSLGAGGWIGSKLETVLPVNCQPPARQVMPAGALVLVIDHSGSMAEPLDDQRHTKEQAADESAVLALKTLSPRDQVGVIAFDSMPTWVVPLGPNQHSDQTAAAIRGITPAGGTEIYPALVAANEALSNLSSRDVPIRHVLLLTDGQSEGGDFDRLITQMASKGITLSTVGVGQDIDEPLLTRFAKLGHGRFYRVSKAATLPRIFIKEAMTLRSSLIREQPFVPRLHRGVSTLIPGIDGLPRLLGMVRTWPKSTPGVEVPILSDTDDPVLADWRIGLGQVAVFTSDASRRWAADWVSSPVFGKFWSQIVRGVARPAMSTTMDTRITRSASGRLQIHVESIGSDQNFQNFLRMSAKVFGPDGEQQPQSITLVQTGPGNYTGEFDAPEAGPYLAMISFAGQNARPGWTAAAYVVNDSAEWHDLHSNEAALRDIAARTGGRVIQAFDPAVNFFDRDNLQPQTASLPITDQLIVLAVITLFLDVAVRRIAWDRRTLARLAAAFGNWVRSYTQVRVSEMPAAVSALRTARQSAQSSLPISQDRSEANPGQPNQTIVSTPSGRRAKEPNLSTPPPVESTAPHDTDDPFQRLAAAKRRAQAKHEADP